MTPNFSIVLIARNEEHTLPRLIGSLKEFQEKGGEILLLDTGSTDQTVKVANDLGCKVHEVGEKFVTVLDEDLSKKINERFIVEGEEPIVKSGDKLFDYASARNYIADFASNDVIATPDCDEIWTKFDLDKICDVIKNGAEQLEYNFVFSHDEFGNEAIKFMHCKFYNRKKLKWEGVVHEILVGQANRVFLGEDIIKLEHYQNVNTNRTGYLRGLALDCYLNPGNDRNSHYLGRELLWTNRPKSAIKELSRHIAMDRWPAERAQSMIYIGDAYDMMGSEEAIDWYNKSFQLESHRREAPLRLATYFWKKADAQKTACYCAMALAIPQSFFYADDQSHYTNYPHELMYWALFQLKDFAGSKEHFDKAFAFKPHNEKYLFDYRWYYRLPKISFVIPTLGRPEGLKKVLNSIDNLNYPTELIEKIVIEDEPRLGVPLRVREGVEKSTGEWIIFASNDIEFTKNSVIEAYLAGKDTGFMVFNTGYVGPDEGNICEHFMIRKDVIDEIGGIFDTDFHHIGVDNLLWNKMKKKGIADRCVYAIVYHNHFSQNPGREGFAMDEVYEIGYQFADKDRALLEVKLKELWKKE